MFYPGSLWVKRIGKLLILSLIGVNLFINKVQDELLKVGEKMMEISATYSDPAASMTYAVEYSILPALEYLEESSLAWMITKYEIPDSESMKEGIADIRSLKEATRQYAPVYKKLALLLKVISLLFWIPIALAVIWILMDIKKSSARYFDIVVLVGAVWFNIWSYRMLIDAFFS